MILAKSVPRVAAILLSFVLASAAMPAQSQSPARAPLPPVSVDPKRAQKVIERGDKAEAEGHVDEALAAYDEAARYAPQDVSALGRGAALRAKLVRTHTDSAENLALAGNISQATDELRVAMRIDPSNSVVAERMAQMEAMKSDDPAPRTQSIEGLPQLKAHSSTVARNAEVGGLAAGRFFERFELFMFRRSRAPSIPRSGRP